MQKQVIDIDDIEFAVCLCTVSKEKRNKILFSNENKIQLLANALT